MIEPQRYVIKFHETRDPVIVTADSIVYHGDRLLVFALKNIAQIGVSLYNLDYYKKV